MRSSHTLYAEPAHFSPGSGSEGFKIGRIVNMSATGNIAVSEYFVFVVLSDVLFVTIRFLFSEIKDIIL